LSQATPPAPPEGSPRVAAVLVSWNSLRLLDACLASLGRQTVGAIHVVVVDNASTDGSLQRLRDEAGLSLIENDSNRGFAAANNQGLAEVVDAEFVLLVNADVQLEPDYVERCLERFHDPEVGAVTGKLLRATPAATIDSTGHSVFGLGWAENRGEEFADAGFDLPHEVFGVCAAAAVYRRAALDSVAVDGKVFDEVYFAYIEDVDLDWRLRWQGWRAWYEPAAVAVHHRSASGARHSAKIMRHILKNRLLTVVKNYDHASLLRNLPGVALFTAVKAVDFAREDPRAALGLLDFATLLPYALRERRRLRAARKVPASSVSAWLRPFPWRARVARRALRRPGRRAGGPPG
jgi:GT2 family glycosyltransferase